MHISIWRQFSSNHSSNFTVVGRFETPEQAATSAKIFREMFEAIWKVQEVREKQGNFKDHDVFTEVELNLAKQFQVDWNPRSLDYAWQVDYIVRYLDNYVFLQNVLDESYNGATPLDQLVLRLGGIPAVTEEMMGDNMIEVDVYGTAKNEADAQTIYDELLPLFNSVEIDEDGFRSLTFETLIFPWNEFAEKRDGQSYRAHLYDGYVAKEGLVIQLTKLEFSAIGYGLPAVLKYLEHKQCSAIHYIIRDLSKQE